MNEEELTTNSLFVEGCDLFLVTMLALLVSITVYGLMQRGRSGEHGGETITASLPT